MYDHFIDYIRQHRLLKTGQRVLLAVSGGLDSMVMADLFKRSPYDFAIAHCNFQLRGDDSKLDEQTVRLLAEQYNTRMHCTRFDTKRFARQEKTSIQMAARTLRYKWLEETRSVNGYDAIATAHHLDDAIETLLIHLARGTGIAGMKGIPRKTNNVIRPLLFATRSSLEAFAREKNIRFREDRSNIETKYTRNKLRHNVVPVFKSINPSLHESMRQFFNRMEGTEAIFRMMTEDRRKACTKQSADELHVLIKPLQELPYPDIFLYEFLKEYGFNASTCRQIAAGLDAQSGKSYHSDTHTLVRDRDRLIVFAPNNACGDGICIKIDPGAQEVSTGVCTFRMERGTMTPSTQLPSDAKTLMADMNKLVFPLLLRSWQAGDRMIPLGMKGHKKISDILTEEKIPLHKKKEIVVLVSGRDIVWLPGIRAGEPFKITGTTLKYLKISMA